MHMRGKQLMRGCGEGAAGGGVCAATTNCVLLQPEAQPFSTVFPNVEGVENAKRILKEGSRVSITTHAVALEGVVDGFRRANRVSITTTVQYYFDGKATHSVTHTPSSSESPEVGEEK